jgi:pyruvate decarboxylase
MERVSAARLQTPVDLTPSIDFQVQESAIQAIQETLFAAKSPVLFIDGLAKSYHVQESCRAIARKLRIPVYHGTMGKAVVDETEEYYAGMYQGIISDPYLQEAFESSDCALIIGAVECDTNSGGFTRKFPVGSIKIDPYEVSVSTLMLE